MTGIENIYLNGSMVGIDKIDSKLQTIVEFAELGEHIWRFYKKTYSSGMQMRLAFSIA